MTSPKKTVVPKVALKLQELPLSKSNVEKLVEIVPKQKDVKTSVHSDSGYGSESEAKAGANSSKRAHPLKKLVNSRSWHLSDCFQWYFTEADQTDATIDDPYAHGHGYHPNVLPRGPDAPGMGSETLDKGKVESDFYFRRHPDRNNPLADIYQFQADYEAPIVWKHDEATGYRYEKKTPTDLDDGRFIEEEDVTTVEADDQETTKRRKMPKRKGFRS